MIFVAQIRGIQYFDISVFSSIISKIFFSLSIIKPTKQNLSKYLTIRPISLAACSKAWVCGLSLAGIMGSNPNGGLDVYLS